MIKLPLVCLPFLIPTLAVSSAAPAKKPVAPDSRFLVSAVDLKKQTIKATHQEKGKSEQYQITPATIIEINGKSANLKHVHPGMEVRSYRLGSGTVPPLPLEDLDLK
jgi:hypothetical protein